MGQAFDNVVARLESRCGPGKRAGQWIRFPHPLAGGKDAKRSFGIMERPDGKVCCVSHKGHTVEETLASLGLNWKDLYPPDDRKFGQFQGSKVVRQYEYLNRQGVKVGAVQRTENKAFPQGRYEEGEFKYGLGETRLPIYMATEVHQAIQDGRIIYIVEGEKDAESLWEQGTPATTRPGGAKGEWTSEQLADLAGARVVIVADKDEPGYECAQRTYQALLSVRCDVLGIVEAKAGKDATDHIAAGLGLGDFVSRLDLIPGPAPSKLVKFNGVFRPVVQEFLWEPYLPKGKMLLLDADGGTGKTSLCIAIAAGTSIGVLPNGEGECEPVRTLYLHSGEDTNEELHTVYMANAGDPEMIRYYGEAFSFDAKGLKFYRTLLGDNKIQVSFVDSLMYFLMGAVRETNDAMSILPVMQALQGIYRELDVAAWHLRHTKKGIQDSKASELGMGTVQFRNSHRGQYVIRWHPDKRGVAVVTDEKGSLKIKRGEGFQFRREGDLVQYIQDAENPFENNKTDSKRAGRPKSEGRTLADEFIREKLNLGEFVAYSAAKAFRADNDKVTSQDWHNALRAAGLSWTDDFMGIKGYTTEMAYDPMKDN